MLIMLMRASQLMLMMLMMRTCLGMGPPGSLPADADDADDAHDAHVLGDEAS